NHDARGAHMIAWLEDVGFSTTVPKVNPMYVLAIAIDARTGRAVGLIKNKGPAALIGKITFPGGKIEPGEGLEDAVSREMREEAGIEVPPAAWTHVASSKEVSVFMADCAQIEQARTMESEPILILDL